MFTRRDFFDQQLNLFDQQPDLFDQQPDPFDQQLNLYDIIFVNLNENSFFYYIKVYAMFKNLERKREENERFQTATKIFRDIDDLIKITTKTSLIANY